MSTFYIIFFLKLHFYPYFVNSFFNELALKNWAIHAFQPYIYSLRPFSRGGAWDALPQAKLKFRPAPILYRVKPLSDLVSENLIIEM